MIDWFLSLPTWAHVVHVAGFCATWITLLRRTGGDQHMNGLRMVAWWIASFLLAQAWLSLCVLYFVVTWNDSTRRHT